MEILIIIIAITPVYLLAKYVYGKDKEKESSQLLKKVFMGGGLAVALTLVLSFFLGKIFPLMGKDTSFMSYEELALYAFFGVALVEEFSKWFFTFLITYNNDEFNESFDAIVYCCFAALGFACLENILYCLRLNSIMVGLYRAVTAVPAHLCNGLFMGYYFSLAKQNKKMKFLYLFLSIIVPTLLHGTYDYIIFSNIDSFLVIFLLYVLVLFSSSIVFIDILSKKNRLFTKRKSKYIYCSKCGTKILGLFCYKCGTKVK